MHTFIIYQRKQKYRGRIRRNVNKVLDSTELMRCCKKGANQHNERKKLKVFHSLYHNSFKCKKYDLRWFTSYDFNKSIFNIKKSLKF